MLKRTLLEGLNVFSGMLPLHWLQFLSGQHLILPFYHTVSEAPLTHIKHLYPVKNKAAFIQDLDFFCKHYEPISLSQLADFVFNGKVLPQNSFLLSFDDGLSQCSDIIAPILKEKGIPAVFFVNSKFVDNKDLMYRYKVSLLIEQIHKNSSAEKKITDLLQAEQLFSKTVSASLLALRWNHLSVIDTIARSLSYDFQNFLATEQPYLTSKQLLTLNQEGFNIGSHSHDHPRYKRISIPEQIKQTNDSQDFVNKLLQPPIKAFAFPFTDDEVTTNFFNTVFNDNIVDLTFGGAGLKKENIKGHLQRIPIENTANQSAQKVIHTEFAYYLIKSLLGKNTIHRK